MNDDREGELLMGVFVGGLAGGLLYMWQESAVWGVAGLVLGFLAYIAFALITDR